MICVLSRFVDDDIVGRVTSSLHIALYVSVAKLHITSAILFHNKFLYYKIVKFHFVTENFCMLPTYCQTGFILGRNYALTIVFFCFVLLQRNNLPAVRQYLETFAINIYLKFPSLVRIYLVNQFRENSVSLCFQSLDYMGKSSLPFCFFP